MHSKIDNKNDPNPQEIEGLLLKTKRIGNKKSFLSHEDNNVEKNTQLIEFPRKKIFSKKEVDGPYWRNSINI